MTTRSAFGTAVIIRRLVISRMRARTLPLTSALPSSSFCSCLSSWWLIFSRSPCRRFCSGTSTLAKTASASRIRPIPATTVAAAAAIAVGKGSARTPTSSCTWRDSQNAAMAAEHEGEHARLQGIDDLLLGEHAAEAGERVEDVELGAERLEGPGPAAHRQRADDREGDHDEAERDDGPEQRRRPAEQLRRSSRRRAAPGRRRSEASGRAIRAASRRRAARRPPARRRRRRRRRSGRGRASARPALPRAPSRACAARQEGSCPGRSSRPCGDCFNADGKLERDKGLDWRPFRPAAARRGRRASVTTGAA